MNNAIFSRLLNPGQFLSPEVLKNPQDCEQTRYSELKLKSKLVSDNMAFANVSVYGSQFDENYLLSNYHINIKSIVKAYLKKILGVTEDELFIFYDDLFEDIYRKTEWTKIDEVHNFFDEMIRKTKKKEPTILDVKKAKLVHKELNDYHFHL